jgi:hypothetical protein
MQINKLLKQYDKEWLLIKVNKFNKNWEPVDGEVIYHSPSGNAVSREMLKLKGDNLQLAVLYAGEFPEDIAFLL